MGGESRGVSTLVSFRFHSGVTFGLCTNLRHPDAVKVRIGESASRAVHGDLIRTFIFAAIFGRPWISQLLFNSPGVSATQRVHTHVARKCSPKNVCFGFGFVLFGQKANLGSFKHPRRHGIAHKITTKILTVHFGKW